METFPPAVFSSGIDEEREHLLGSSQLLRPMEVARRLKVSRTWVYAAAKCGLLPCVRLGGPEGPLRFEASAIDAFVTTSRQKCNIV